MRRIRELTGHERFTPVHAALLVLCLDGLGCSFIRATHSRPSVPATLGVPVFIFGSWYGILLLAWQRRSPYPLLFGVELTAVNAAWAAWLFLLRDPGKPLRDEHLVWAATLCVLGLLVALPGLAQRWRSMPARQDPR